MTTSEMLEILYRRTREKMLRRRAQLAAASRESDEKKAKDKQ